MTHGTQKSPDWIKLCGAKVNILVHLQKSFVYYQVSGGEVK